MLNFVLSRHTVTTTFTTTLRTNTSSSSSSSSFSLSARSTLFKFLHLWGATTATTTTSTFGAVGYCYYWLIASGVGVRAMSSSSSTTSALPSPSSTLPSKTKTRIAVAQICTTNNKLRNLFDVATCAGLALSSEQQQQDQEYARCTMLFIPECFGYLGESTQQTLEQAEPAIMSDEIDATTTHARKTRNPPKISELLRDTVKQTATAGKVPDFETEYDSILKDEGTDTRIDLLDGIRTIAGESRMWISGTMHTSGAPSYVDQETGQERQRIYNTHVLIDPEGAIRGIYHKIHLFDVSIPGKVQLQESQTTAPGTKIVLVPNTPIGTIGLSTCYDMRFPEQYVELVRHGSHCILVPSAFTVPTGHAHWHTLLRARAIETQCYVIASAQYGRHNPKRESYGHSVVIDPWGTILADAGGYDDSTEEKQKALEALASSSSLAKTTPSIITCEIDLAHLESIRRRMPVQQHRENAQWT